MTFSQHRNIPASIELSTKHVLDQEGSYSLFPKGTSVYLVDIGTESDKRFADAAAKLREDGYNPVPHFAARRFPSINALENRLAAMKASAEISQVLAIGGGLAHPAGPFSSTMDMLNTGLFQQYGINKIGVAGHPEGSPDFDNETCTNSLLEKQAFGVNAGIDIYIITQFGFDPKVFIDWADGLPDKGINLRVHMGISGPAKITSLLKFAMISGVGNSIHFLKRHATSITTLATGFNPETMATPIEAHWLNNSNMPIEQLHIFAFGGATNAAQWLKKRGSW